MTVSSGDSVNAPPPVTTTEIPPAQLQQPPSIDDPYSSSPPEVREPASQSNAADTAAANKAIQEYEDAQNLGAPGSVPRLHTLNEFLSETSETSPIGVELREDICKLNNGAKAEGLAVLSVRKDSPAAKAGLQSAHNTTHQVLEGASVIAALVFPPAIMATAIIDETRVGESYDVIIGVDGKRVSNVLEFEDQIRDLKGGDVVYLTVVRKGSRLQIPVQVPPGTAWTY
jgi:C-terminal processing protease CtpA/Prc